MKSSKPNNMMMKSGSPIEYNFTSEERKYLKYTDTCVEDNLIGVYGEIIKKFTKEKLVEIASDFYDDKINDWIPSMGYSPDAIKCICKYFGFSMYAYDIMNSCF